MRRIAAAAFIYFALVFAAGLALGPVRVLWLEPQIGPALAVLFEAPFLVLAMALAAPRATRWAGAQGPFAAYLAIGLLALLMLQAADFAVGLFLRGLSVRDQLALFLTPAGWIYAATLALFALMPTIARPRIARPRARRP